MGSKLNKIIFKKILGKLEVGQSEKKKLRSEKKFLESLMVLIDSNNAKIIPKTYKTKQFKKN